VAEITTVTTVRGKIPADLRADPDFVYVGRSCAGWTGSPWGNPFRIGMRPLAATNQLIDVHHQSPQPIRIAFAGPLDAWKVVECYAAWLQARPALRSRLPALRGKVLGCWCGDWRPEEPEIPCHAVVLAQLANALLSPEEADRA
jgi:hypothetical protein